MLGAYTLSKSTDNGSGIRMLGTDPLNPQNSYCLSCEDGLSVFDQRQRFVTSIVYDLPFGAGRRFATEGPLNQIVGGWKVTSVITVGSGFPLTVSAGEDSANIGNCCRPNRDFSMATALDNPTVDKWFNTAAYSRAARTEPSAPPGAARSSGPESKTGISRCRRSFTSAKRPYLEFRSEAFNFLNHPNWGDPNATFNSTAFGTISSTRTDMRQLQFGLKLVF